MKSLGGITPFRGALREALKEYGMERKVREHELLVRWSELAGAAIANHATPTRFRDGVLYLRVPDAAWRQELSLRRAELRKKLNEALHEELVTDVVVR